MDYKININGKIGNQPEDIKCVYLEAVASNQVEKIYVEFNDGHVEKIDRIDDRLSYEKFGKAVIEFLKGVGASKKGEDWIIAKNEKASKKMFAELEKKIKKQEKEAQKEEIALTLPEEAKNVKVNANKKLFAGKKIKLDKKRTASIASAASIVGLTIALSACGPFAQIAAPTVEAPVFETVVEEEQPVIMNTQAEEIELTLEGKDWDYYDANFSDTYQKDWMKNYLNFVGVNRSEDWMYCEITPEIKDVLEKAGITVTEDEAIFGFTAEQVHAFNLVYGTHTNEQYAVLMNGEYIDIAKVISSAESDSNRFIANAIVYYLNNDDAHLHVENAAAFTETEIAEITKFEDMLQEVKDLLKEARELRKDGKDKEATAKVEEAKAKMKALKEAIVAYAYQPNVGVNNAKPYILRSILPVASIISRGYNFKDKATLHLYDAVNGTYIDKEVDTDLFDEVTMRELVEGYNGCIGENGIAIEAFDQIEFLKQFRINTKQYSLVISDDGVSKADSYTGSLVSKLEAANSYIENLRKEDFVADVICIKNDPNANVKHNSELDELTKETYNADAILELINAVLVKENRYPKQMEAFTSEISKFVQETIEYRNYVDSKSGKSNKNDGKEIVKVLKTIPGKVTYVPGTSYTRTWTETWTEEYTSTRTEVRPNENYAAEDAAARAAAVEQASKTTVIDGATGKEKPTTYQDIINNTQNNTNMMKDNGTDKSQLTDANTKTNLDNDDIINNNDPVVKTIKEEVEKNNREYEENKARLEQEAKEVHQEGGTTHYITGGDTHIDPEFADAIIESGYVAPQATPDYTTQSTPAPAPQPEPTPVQESAPEGYTNVDPTTSFSFAPAVEEDYSSASESEIDAIVESMAAPVESNDGGEITR